MPTLCSQVVISQPGKVGLAEAALPEPGRGEVLLRASKSLLSPGTERALLLNLPGLKPTYPKTSGYSFVGEVVQLGDGATNLQLGDRVACRTRHASHAIVDAADCHKLPASLSDERAAFFQLLAIALQGVRKTRLEIGEGCAVLGAGLVGLLALQVARAAGAMPVIAIDADASRLARAKDLGADHVFLAGEAARLLPEAPPVVIDATGNPAALEAACQLAAFGGRVALLGSSRGASQSFDFYRDVHKRGLTLLGAHISATYRETAAPGWWTQRAEQATALKLLEQERVAAEPLVTHRFPFRDVEAAYQLLADWDPGTIGVVIDWTTA